MNSIQINFRATEQTKQELDALVAASVSPSKSEYIRHLIHREYQELTKGEKKMDTKETADEIIRQSESAFYPNLPIEKFAPVEEVQKWLDATDNIGNAEAISEEIYELLEN